MCKTLALAALTILGACSSTAPPGLQAWIDDPRTFDLIPAKSFEKARTLQPRFDAPDAQAGWREGDEVTFGLELESGATVTRWFMQLRVPANAETREGMIFVRVTDKDGKEELLEIPSSRSSVEVRIYDAETLRVLGSTKVMMPHMLLTRGVRRAAEICAELMQQPTHARQRRAAEAQAATTSAFYAIRSLLDLVQEDKVLAPYLWRIISKPSAFSLLRNLGVRVDATCEFTRVAPAARLPRGIPQIATPFLVPMHIDVNGERALQIKVLAAKPQRPYALCGGIVALEARHPTDASRRLRAALLSAETGAPQ